jgi:alanine racemase
MRPTWAEVSLRALRANFRRIQQHVGRHVTVCAVVKADAYGHGAAECSRALEAEGAAWLGVTSTEEGVRLREHGLRARILLMTGFWRGEQDDVVRHALTPAAWQGESLELLKQAVSKVGAQRVPVHVKIDTGMARLGLPHTEAAQFAEDLRRHPELEVEGLFTHLASAEIVDASSNALQSTRFDEARGAFRAAGFAPRYIHMANSAAIVSNAGWRHNFVRPGISLYGYYLPFLSSSGRPVEARGLPVEPVLAWKTRIIGLRHVGPNQPIGYDGAYVTRASARIAVLPVGYADGLNRKLSSQGRVLVRGEFAPIVGNVSMDITLIDISAVARATIGDEVVIIGHQGSRAIDAWEHATLAQTIPYEILCNISSRVPRVAVEA